MKIPEYFNYILFLKLSLNCDHVKYALISILIIETSSTSRFSCKADDVARPTFPKLISINFLSSL